MTRLSVNINKIALIRNSRGSNLPDLVQMAIDCEQFGAQGITVHPRPDERHIHYADVPALRPIVSSEFNIEGNPTPAFMELVLKNKPEQCTLVPDDPGQLTSDAGWDTVKHEAFLKDIIQQLHNEGIRVSIFIDPIESMTEGAKKTGTDSIEFYTGPYAEEYKSNKEAAIEPFVRCAHLANKLGLGINAGHDLNLDNLNFFKNQIPELLEVSIGHAIISDALYFGMKNTIQMYLRELE